MSENKTNLDWNKFENKFGTWAKRIKPFFMEGKMDGIYTFLKQESQKGKQIGPNSMNTFRAFKETPLEDLKCVIVCQDPYYKFVNGESIATGLAMDCSITEKVQPTLQQFYNGIEKELYNGLNLSYIDDFNLDYLTKQGVLLLNATLTVEKDKPGSHSVIWKEFTEYVLTEIIAFTGVPILFLGKEASSFAPLVEKSNYVYTLAHPASASYNGGIWDTKDTFSKINKNLEDSNEDTIMWLNIDAPF